MNSFPYGSLPHLGREAKENNIFFVANHSTTLSDWLAEGPAGLRRLAAASCSIGAFLILERP